MALFKIISEKQPFLKNRPLSKNQPFKIFHLNSPNFNFPVFITVTGYLVKKPLTVTFTVIKAIIYGKKDTIFFNTIFIITFFRISFSPNFAFTLSLSGFLRLVFKLMLP